MALFSDRSIRASMASTVWAYRSVPMVSGLGSACLLSGSVSGEPSCSKPMRKFAICTASFIFSSKFMVRFLLSAIAMIAEQPCAHKKAAPKGGYRNNGRWAPVPG